MATRLILIRHGQTDWNKQRKYSGFLDMRLNKKGKDQAKKLQQRLKDEFIHRVYSSDRKRALETARIIFSKSRIHRVSGLREVRFGIFEGLTYKEIIKKHPVVYKEWLNNPFSTTIPKGESLNSFKKRVIKALGKIIALNKGKTVAIVCHGGTISVFINQIMKSNDFWEKIPRSASLSIVEYGRGKNKLKLFNDTGHLNG